ncbi:MAG: hypothetical protein JW763_10215 [candidate division Zixibacteria bacterium]|nr:hypothetical protein [candidate division Zixibacteria bacterium]
MPFCPKCRYEYNPDVLVCPDCNEPLVAILPPELEEPSPELIEKYDDWVQMARLTSQPSAAMVMEVFKEKHIPAVLLSGSGHFGITGQMGMSSFRPVNGAYSIIVPREFIVDANHEAEIILGDEWKKALLITIS